MHFHIIPPSIDQTLAFDTMYNNIKEVEVQHTQFFLLYLLHLEWILDHLLVSKNYTWRAWRRRYDIQESVNDLIGVICKHQMEILVGNGKPKHYCKPNPTINTNGTDST